MVERSIRAENLTEQKHVCHNAWGVRSKFWTIEVQKASQSVFDVTVLYNTIVLQIAYGIIVKLGCATTSSAVLELGMREISTIVSSWPDIIRS